MLFPHEVLPTPGGPYRQIMGDLRSPLSFKTAKYSSMRILTLSNPAVPVDIQLDKIKLFEDFFKQKKGQNPSEELKELFFEILNSES